MYNFDKIKADFLKEVYPSENIDRLMSLNQKELQDHFMNNLVETYSRTPASRDLTVKALQYSRPKDEDLNGLSLDEYIDKKHEEFNDYIANHVPHNREEVISCFTKFLYDNYKIKEGDETTIGPYIGAMTKVFGTDNEIVNGNYSMEKKDIHDYDNVMDIYNDFYGQTRSESHMETLVSSLLFYMMIDDYPYIVSVIKPDCIIYEDFFNEVVESVMDGQNEEQRDDVKDLFFKSSKEIYLSEIAKLKSKHGTFPVGFDSHRIYPHGVYVDLKFYDIEMLNAETFDSLKERVADFVKHGDTVTNSAFHKEYIQNISNALKIEIGDKTNSLTV